MTSGQPRVILWAVPRSISTAFFRAMMNKKKMKVCHDSGLRTHGSGLMLCCDKLLSMYMSYTVLN